MQPRAISASGCLRPLLQHAVAVAPAGPAGALYKTLFTALSSCSGLTCHLHPARALHAAKRAAPHAVRQLRGLSAPCFCHSARCRNAQSGLRSSIAPCIAPDPRVRFCCSLLRCTLLAQPRSSPHCLSMHLPARAFCWSACFALPPAVVHVPCRLCRLGTHAPPPTQPPHTPRPCSLLVTRSSWAPATMMRQTSGRSAAWCLSWSLATCCECPRWLVLLQSAGWAPRTGWAGSWHCRQTPVMLLKLR